MGGTAKVAAPGPAEAALLARIEQLTADNHALRAQRDRLVGAVERLTEANRLLRAQVAELRRAAKRQAAPFSKGKPVSSPRRPGRKPGPAYGPKAWRRMPPQIDRVVPVVAPAACPSCGGEIAVVGIAQQYQQDLPPPTAPTTRFDVHLGRCQHCHRRVRPRHPEQTSDALGAAGTHLGPRAIALAAWARVGLGLSAGKTARLLGQLGITITPGGVTQALARAAGRATPTYQALVNGVRASPVVAPDETGWRVAGHKAWLWALVGDQVTIYRIAPGRGYRDAATVLGEDYAGVIERDGWAPYRKFVHATHQTCLAHLLRRCHELLADAKRGQAKTPHAVRRILQRALAVRDARDAGALDPAEAAAAARELGTAIDRLIAGQTAYQPNRKLLNHLARERTALFTFLGRPGVQATNWRAEHAIRPAVITRKVWGGNRTWAGAATWQVLASVLTTATQQQRDPVTVLLELLRNPRPGLADLTIPALPARGP